MVRSCPQRLPTSQPSLILINVPALFFDSIEQAGLILNDSQIISVNASKRWALADEGPGVLLTIISTQECDAEEPDKT